MKPAAQIISFVFHPLLLTTYLVLLLGIFFPVILGINPAVLYLFSLFIFVLTFVLPVLNILLVVKIAGMKQDGLQSSSFASSVLMAYRKERVVPFILVSLIYLSVAGLFFYKAILGMNFNKIMFIVAALVVIGTVITFFYKISIHSLAIGGFIGMLLPMNKIAGGTLLWPTIIGVVIAGLIMSSRLALNAHTPREVLTGILTGFVAGFGGIMLLF